MNYRKFLIFIIVLMILILGSFFAQARQASFELTAKSAILMEVESGDVLFGKNRHLRLPPASMTKIMTMLLVMDTVSEDKASLDDKIITSEYAASMGGSQVYLEAGEEMTLASLMKAIAISSANDASVVVAEYIYGTELDFVKRMNERSKELGLKNTYFYNTNGLPPDNSDIEGNYTSAYDLAVLSRDLLKYPEVLEWTSTWIDYLRGGEFVLNNTNKLVRHYQGADGIKTGYTREAKYCVSSTAKRNGLRFIAVIMGADSSQKRFSEAAKLLSYGFNSYNSMLIADKDEIIKEINIFNARNEKIKIIPEEKVIVPVKKGEEDLIRKEIILSKKIKAPLIKGDSVGFIKIYKGNYMLKEIELIVNRDVNKAGFFQLLFRIINNLIKSLVNIFM